MLPVGAAALYELLRLLLKIRSQEQGVIPRLIASDDDLKRLAVFPTEKTPFSGAGVLKSSAGTQWRCGREN